MGAPTILEANKPKTLGRGRMPSIISSFKPVGKIKKKEKKEETLRRRMTGHQFSREIVERIKKNKNGVAFRPSRFGNANCPWFVTRLSVLLSGVYILYVLYIFLYFCSIFPIFVPFRPLASLALPLTFLHDSACQEHCNSMVHAITEHYLIESLRLPRGDERLVDQSMSK